jgi:hypothetical protein
VVFGNDGRPSGNDKRVSAEIAAVRDMLTRFDGKEIAFVEESSSSWAMACDLSRSALKPDVLEKKMWTTWNNHTETERYDAEYENVKTDLEIKTAHAVLERNGLL